MTIVVAVVRLVLAGVFIVSAIAKLRDRSGSRAGVEAFGVPAVFVGLVAGALPVVELACAALLLLPDPFATVGAVGSLALLLAFTVAIVVNLVQGKHPECHCFGDLGESGGIGWATVARNVALMVLPASPWSVPVVCAVCPRPWPISPPPKGLCSLASGC